MTGHKKKIIPTIGNWLAGKTVASEDFHSPDCVFIFRDLAYTLQGGIPGILLEQQCHGHFKRDSHCRIPLFPCVGGD